MLLEPPISSLTATTTDRCTAALSQRTIELVGIARNGKFGGCGGPPLQSPQANDGIAKVSAS